MPRWAHVATRWPHKLAVIKRSFLSASSNHRSLYPWDMFIWKLKAKSLVASNVRAIWERFASTFFRLGRLFFPTNFEGRKSRYFSFYFYSLATPMFWLNLRTGRAIPPNELTNKLFALGFLSPAQAQCFCSGVNKCQQHVPKLYARAPKAARAKPLFACGSRAKPCPCSGFQFPLMCGKIL